MSELRDRLLDAPLRDETAASERAWRVVAAAFDARETPRRRAPARRRLALAAVACAAAAGVALSPAGAAVGGWVHDVVRPEPPAVRTRHALGALPGHGRLLVRSRSGPWIVQADGSRRRLGPYEDTALSPHGLFVAVTRGRLLGAVDPRGGVRWTLDAPSRVTRPAWSPDGFRIAYRSGRSLRVVYGDGALDRRLVRRSAAVTPAWRPGARHLLASVDADGRVALRDADTGALRWRRGDHGVRALDWSPDGRRLLVLDADGVRLLTAAGRTLHVRRMPPGSRARAAAWLPGSRRYALVRADAAGRSAVVLVTPGRRAARQLLALPGPIADVLASPDGQRLLLTSPAADQWLIVRTAGPARLTAVSGIGRQFAPRERGTPRTPRPVAWIP